MEQVARPEAPHVILNRSSPAASSPSVGMWIETDPYSSDLEKRHVSMEVAAEHSANQYITPESRKQLLNYHILIFSPTSAILSDVHQSFDTPDPYFFTWLDVCDDTTYCNHIWLTVSSPQAYFIVEDTKC